MAEAEELEFDKSTRKSRKCKFSRQVLVKDEIRARFKQIRDILKKCEEERTVEEVDILRESPEVVKAVHKRVKIKDAQKQRVLEIEDEAEILQTKCQQLASAIKASNKVVIYTGAGISTAASIPDYRGPNGVWTLLKQGKELEAQDLCDAEPTYTHMGIVKLFQEGHLKHVVSQNCDGLHIRSGLPRQILSEVHGNMFIEQCKECKPHKEYIRLFDTTERTGVRRHETGRKCHKCNGSLRDTIVHFGEKGGLKSPYRWKEAVKAANNSDLILCLGSSLKLLKKYSCLWCMERRIQKRPKLYIVNLQWTPKDDGATLKINGRCDDVIQQIMSCLGYGVPTYQREKDPIFSLSTPLRKKEFKTTSKKILEIPPGYAKPQKTRRKPLLKVKVEQDSKQAIPEYSTIKSLLCPKNPLPASKGSVNHPVLSVHSPSCDRLDSVRVKIEPSLDLTEVQTMQVSDKCFRLLSGQGNMVLPQFIPPSNVPVPFQSAVLATNVLGVHDLKIVSGMMSKGPKGVSSSHVAPPDIPKLPGSVILDHCYCKQINCKGECRNSPEKTLGPQTTESSSKSDDSVQYYGNEQDEAMDLSNLSSRDQPLDLSPGSHRTQGLPAGTQSDSPSSESYAESKPPGLILAASLLNTGQPQLETFADLQKYCMMGFPPSLKSSSHRVPTLPHPTTISYSSLSTIDVKPFPQTEQCTIVNTHPHSQTHITAIVVKDESKRVSDNGSVVKQEVEVISNSVVSSETVEASAISTVTEKTDSGTKDTKELQEETEKSSGKKIVIAEKCAQRTKRRISSSSSVPGWFGKGLAIKKRRRF